MGVSGGTGDAPSLAGWSTLASNASGLAPLEADLEARGAREGGGKFCMVDLKSSVAFKGEFKSVAGESKRRGKLIAVKLRFLTAVGRFDQ